ncbi:MAG: very short patch repair endonuclease [Candidatus Pacearchaeota archaeon]|nr:very short patch repair endonuclease [Candidatus Pacearchaeota archaeon]
MVDRCTKEQRSYNMSCIKCRDTKPELRLRQFFEKKGFLYQSDKYGKPDFINKKKKIVIFIDGCFWHKCPEHFRCPESNKEYWLPKLRKNVLRDKEVTLNYKNSGWKVIRIWEHELRNPIPENF